MDLSGVELVLSSFVLALLVLALVQSQRLGNLQERVRRLELAVAPPKVSGLSSEVEQEVLRLLDARRKIQAIKLVRDRTGLGLREAKELVERY